MAMSHTARILLGVGLVAAVALVASRHAPTPEALPPPRRQPTPKSLHAPPLPNDIAGQLANPGPSSLAFALQILDDPRPTVRAGAAAWLGRKRSPLAVAPLIRRLRDGDSAVRCAAATALGLIGDPQALPFLRRTMTDPDLPTADAARRAVQRISTQPTTKRGG
jgi:HEAT repeat protein